MDQLTSKGRKIIMDIQKFQGIYVKIEGNRASGSDEKRVMVACREAFKDQTKRHFKYEAS